MALSHPSKRKGNYCLQNIPQTNSKCFSANHSTTALKQNHEKLNYDSTALLS